MDPYTLLQKVHKEGIVIISKLFTNDYVILKDNIIDMCNTKDHGVLYFVESTKELPSDSTECMIICSDEFFENHLVD